MLIQSILVSIWAFMNGRVFNEYFCWIIRGAPLVTGTITGILMGDWKSGAMIGATIQLLYMGNVTVGGIASYDKCYASIIATAVCIGAHQTPEIAVTIAVTLGTLGLIASNIFMTVSVSFVHMADKYIEKGETKKIWIFKLAASAVIDICVIRNPGICSGIFRIRVSGEFHEQHSGICDDRADNRWNGTAGIGNRDDVENGIQYEIRSVYRNWIFVCCLSAYEHYRLCSIGNCLCSIVCNIAVG